MAGERVYQTALIKKVKKMFPGCTVLLNDPARNQGIPDLLILFKDRWAMLEVKLSEDAARQVNQEFYVYQYNDMSFASFIYPENEEQVLNDLQSAFGCTR